MHRSIPLFLAITFFGQLSFSQSNYSIATYNPTPQAFKYLLMKNADISANDTINETVVDLVDPMLVDSVITRKKEHHQLFLVGWLIHAFGDFNWRAISMHKEKYVGTAVRNSRSGEEEYTEYDINFDLNFHLAKYLNQAFYCYDCQRQTHRQDVRGKKHRTDYNKPPFVRDSCCIDISQYRLHCELTPPAPFRPQLHYLFYPTQPGLSLKDHPNFGSDQPAMGFYGVNCLDCNHNCHPELHPYEWTWWLNLKNGQSTDKTWLVGLFHEGSNRFRHWSHNPMTGATCIPFAYQLKDEPEVQPAIYVEHLVFNKFLDNEVAKLNIPDSTFDSHDNLRVLKVADNAGAQYKIYVHFENALPTNGLKYWLSDLNLDKQTHVLSGYLHIALSVKDLYTTKITFTDERLSSQ